ncbi:MAG: prepilin-type N-terminal cleavage/methylation domain-containing protein [Planctomycetota bacterium]|nr:prepilin-type N-terminal cleavage/methylation domain-containing protein [Planctomycetota bacterium]MDA1105651.1 prepilin-type N-terminal cleavage/methylation domain-containing protein [Planctomycetota bacterium]
MNNSHLNNYATTSKGSSKGTKRGFTLIEILIVVIILSVLAALVVPSVTSALDDSNTKAAEARAGQILTMITRYNEFNGDPALDIDMSAAGQIASADLTKLVSAGYCVNGDLTNQVSGNDTWYVDANGKVAPTN